MGITKRGKNLIIDFFCYTPDNRKIRCRENEGNDEPKNRKRVNQKWKAVQYHLIQNTFDYLKFFPHGPRAKYFTNPAESNHKKSWIN